MPRYSAKHFLFHEIQQLNKRRELLSLERKVDEVIDEEEDRVDDFIAYLQHWIAISRFLYRQVRYRKRNKWQYWKGVLTGENADVNDAEFIALFRMTRRAIVEVIGLIQDYAVFQSQSIRKQTAVEFQVMIFVYYLGNPSTNVTT